MNTIGSRRNTTATATAVLLLLLVLGGGPRLGTALEITGVRSDQVDLGAAAVTPVVQQAEVAIHNQVAASVHSFQVRNTSTVAVEITCAFQLANAELVDGFAYWNGSEKIVGEVLPKEDARRIYQQVAGVRRRDPGFLEKLGSTFRFQVFPLQPGELKPVELHTVEAPEDARRVVAYFPFGLVTELRLDRIRQRWSCRFLVPRNTADGVYTIRVQVVRADGSSEWSEVRYTIDGTAPEMVVSLPPTAPSGGRVWVEVDPLEPVTAVTASLLGDATPPVELCLDPVTGRYSGSLPIPAAARDQVVVRVVLRDFARNCTQEDHVIQVPDLAVAGSAPVAATSAF